MHAPSGETKNHQKMRQWVISKITPDSIIAASLFCLGLATRIPFASRLAYSSDGARFALALEHYDVSQMRPHAPGYILYIALAKCAQYVLNDATASLVAVSVISSAITIVLVFALAAKMFGRTTGLGCSLLLLTSPLFWFNSGMPLTYALEGVFALAFVVACYQVMLGRSGWLQPAAILLGLTAGVRQTLIFILVPLLVYAMKRCRVRQIILSLVICTLTCLAWLIPMIALTGSLSKYLIAVQAQYGSWVVASVPFSDAVRIRTGILLKWLGLSLYLGVLPLVYYIGRMFAVPNAIRDERIRLLLLWLIPSVAYLVGFNIYNSGHIVFLLPAVFIVLGKAIQAFGQDVEKGAAILAGYTSTRGGQLLKLLSYKAVSLACFGIIAVTNIYLFLGGTSEMSYAAIKQSDLQLEQKVNITREKFDSDRSMIVTCWSNTQAGLYLPDFLVCCPLPLIFEPSDLPIKLQNVYMSKNLQTTPKTYWLETDFKVEPLTIPGGIDTLIIWEEEIASYLQNVDRLEKLTDENLTNEQIFYLKVKPGEKLRYDYHFLKVD